MDDENAGDKFCEEDIEDILMKRSQVITHKEEKGSTFSKATFSSADTDQDISIDDPDFWKKWAKKAQIEEVDEKTRLMMVEPRKRTQINYNNVESGAMSGAMMSDESSSEDENEGRMSRTRDQKIKDKRRSLMQGNGKEGTRRNRRGRSMWDGDDDDYIETERDVEYGSWSKSDLFRLEKAVMTFGWGRWEEVLSHSGLRKGWTNTDVEVSLPENKCIVLMGVWARKCFPPKM